MRRAVDLETERLRHTSGDKQWIDGTPGVAIAIRMPGPVSKHGLKRKLSLALRIILVLPILLTMHGLNMNALVFTLGSKIEVRFLVPELNDQSTRISLRAKRR